jgi:hypothetical protein
MGRSERWGGAERPPERRRPERARGRRPGWERADSGGGAGGCGRADGWRTAGGGMADGWRWDGGRLAVGWRIRGDGGGRMGGWGRPPHGRNPPMERCGAPPAGGVGPISRYAREIGRPLDIRRKARYTWGNRQESQIARSASGHICLPRASPARAGPLCFWSPVPSKGLEVKPTRAPSRRESEATPSQKRASGRAGERAKAKRKSGEEKGNASSSRKLRSDFRAEHPLNKRWHAAQRSGATFPRARRARALRQKGSARIERGVSPGAPAERDALAAIVANADYRVNSRSKLFISQQISFG